MSDVNQVRINELARELEVKAKAIIDLLAGYGVTEKKNALEFHTRGCCGESAEAHSGCSGRGSGGRSKGQGGQRGEGRGGEGSADASGGCSCGACAGRCAAEAGSSCCCGSRGAITCGAKANSSGYSSCA
jgi:hypothetical protein